MLYHSHVKTHSSSSVFPILLWIQHSHPHPAALQESRTGLRVPLPFISSTTHFIRVPTSKVYLKPVPIPLLPWHRSGPSNCFTWRWLQQPRVSSPRRLLQHSEYMNFSHGPGTPPSPVRTQVALPLSLQITVRVPQAPVPAVSFRLPEHLKHLWACGLQVMQLFLLLCLPHSSPTAASTSFTSLLNCHRHRQPSPDTS